MALSVVSVAQGWPDDRPGGLNRYAADLHQGLLSVGVDNRLAVFGPALNAGRGVFPAGPESASLPARIGSLSRVAKVAGADADVLATHFSLYGTVPSMLPGLRNRPRVAHFHGPWGGESVAQGQSRRKASVKTAIEGMHLRSADRVVADSRAFMELAVRLHRIDERKISFVHPGVDLAKFSPLDDEDRMRLRQRLGIAESQRLVVTARRIVPRMGLDTLLDAWPDRLDMHLAIIGDGPLRQSLERSSAGRGNVIFTGRVDDPSLVEWYQAADLVVVPSTALEGFGLIVLEALACGTPVMASRVGGMAEVLSEIDAGLLLPPGDVEAWRKALLLPAGAFPDRRECRLEAEKRSIPQFARKIEEIYAGVL